MAAHRSAPPASISPVRIVTDSRLCRSPPRPSRGGRVARPVLTNGIAAVVIFTVTDISYQVPAMILRGQTLEFSPVLSLMVDQLRKLPAFLPGDLLASNQLLLRQAVCGFNPEVPCSIPSAFTIYS
uniref:Uncharacterized protein n=1 Tax=Oryza meridionalis TaxID=40149 RepID=A0A0E0DGX8_9ORYZ